jgi:hypothetical protein
MATDAVAGDLNDRRWLTQDHLTGLEWINQNISVATSGTISNSTYTNNLNLVAALNIYGYSDYRIAAMHEINTIPANSSSTFFNSAYMKYASISTTLSSCTMRTSTRYFERFATTLNVVGNAQITSTSTRSAIILRTM